MLDPKDIKPEGFKGQKTDNFKHWANKFKDDYNGKRGGFRKTFERAPPRCRESMQED